ncbi:MAG: arginine--tRNA ligase, partial [Vulcanimicrobiaceae bacterium]
MTTLPSDLERIAAALTDAAREFAPDARPVVAFEPPRNPEFGDFATNVAFGLAKAARKPPQTIATELIAAIFARDPELRGLLADARAVGGFINLRMTPAFWQAIVAAVLRDGSDFGRGVPTGRRISLEFGSANPTGPLVVVQGRTLSIGASLASAMRFVGHDVTTEWIINDAGAQLDTLARSLYARYRQLVEPAYLFPDDGYPGDYLIPLARRLRDRDGARWDAAAESEWLTAFAEFGRDAIVAEQQAVADRFGVTFDRWQSEKALHDAGLVAAGIAALHARGLTFEQEGATWMRTTQFGDDKDRVLVRADGRPTYMAPDVAYHYDKLQRSDEVLLILGPDHHGYVKRLETIAAAYGRIGAIEVIISQLVTTVRDGVVVSSSKRAGEILTLADIIDDVGVDAARFFFVMLSTDQPLTFDLTLATEQSNENPVFYVQYGHA